MEHDLVERIVLDDAPARQVLRPCLGFPPCGKRLQSSEHGGIAARQLEALPCIFWRKGEARRIGKPLHLLIEPRAAAGLLQLVHHAREDGRKVRDVGNGIVDLTLVERTAPPVGEAGAFVEAVPKHALDQVGIADLLAVSERHRRDLRVEQRVGDLVGEIMNDFQVLAAGVKDLEHLLVVHEQVEQRFEVDFRLRVDRSSLIAARHLDQAELGPIGILAHELGVHGDERLLGKAFDERLEIVRVGNQGMDTHESPRALAAASRVDKRGVGREARGDFHTSSPRP